jgi:hypothetical protein
VQFDCCYDSRPLQTLHEVQWTRYSRLGNCGIVWGLCGPGWTVQGSNPGWGARFSAPVQTGPGAHPASCTMGIGSFPGVKSGQGVTLIPQPLLVPWSRKGRAIPLLSLWAVRPVQSLSACTRVHFTFYLHGSCGVSGCFASPFVPQVRFLTLFNRIDWQEINR